MSKGSVEFNYYEDRLFNGIDLGVEDLTEIRHSYLGSIGSVDVYIIDDEYVRNFVDIDFTMAGNYAHDGYIPIGDIWISELLDPTDVGPTLVHEYIESYLMEKSELDYEEAHDIANEFEVQYRDRIVDGLMIDDYLVAFTQAKTIVDAFRSSHTNAVNFAETRLPAILDGLMSA